MNRRQFLTEVYSIAKFYDCIITDEGIWEKFSLNGDTMCIQSSIFCDGDQVILPYNEYGDNILYITYSNLAKKLRHEVKNRERKIFDDDLYDEIANFFIKTGGYKTLFEKEKGRYAIQVEYNEKVRWYEDYCTDMKDQYEKVETNFDTCLLENKIQEKKTANEMADRDLFLTEFNLRKIA